MEMEIPKEAIVLVGGKGTRLQSVVNDRPKPMATVCDKPFLEWLLLSLRRQGIRRVVLATGHQARKIENYFSDGSEWNLDIAYSHEKNPLGTGGAIRQAAEHVTSKTILVLNGDSYCRMDLSKLSEFHFNSNARCTLWLVPQVDCSRYGSVTTESDGSVVAFGEKARTHGAGLINSGVYLIDRCVLSQIPKSRATSLEREVFPKLVGNGLYGIAGCDRFLDIGTPESYARCDQFIKEERESWPAAA